MADVPLDTAPGLDPQERAYYWIPDQLTAAPGDSIRIGGAAGQLPGNRWTVNLSRLSDDPTVVTSLDVAASHDSSVVATLPPDADYSRYWAAGDDGRCRLHRGRRLKPGRIVIVGGKSVVSAGVANTVKRLCPRVDRVAGRDRYDTSAWLIGYVYGGSADTIPFATGRDYPDALSASAAAAARGWQLMLVDGLAGAGMDPETQRGLASLASAKQNLVVGGQDVITPATLATMTAAMGPVGRIGGVDRFDTSLRMVKTAFQQPTKRAFSATGYQYPDALAGTAAAGHAHAPLLLSQTTCLPNGARDTLYALAVHDVTIIGGRNVLGPGLMSLKCR